MTFVTLFVVASCAPNGAQYPAGVDPAKCPNFPICDNAALHSKETNHWNQPQQWQPAPQQWNQQPAPQQWNQPQQWQPAPQQWNQQPAPQQWNHIEPASTKGGDKFPSGVNPQSCPNYPYCDTPIIPAGHGHAQAYRAAPLQGINF